MQEFQQNLVDDVKKAFETFISVADKLAKNSNMFVSNIHKDNDPSKEVIGIRLVSAWNPTFNMIFIPSENAMDENRVECFIFPCDDAALVSKLVLIMNNMLPMIKTDSGPITMDVIGVLGPIIHDDGSVSFTSDIDTVYGEITNKYYVMRLAALDAIPAEGAEPAEPTEVTIVE